MNASQRAVQPVRFVTPDSAAAWGFVEGSVRVYQDDDTVVLAITFDDPAICQFAVKLSPSNAGILAAQLFSSAIAAARCAP